MPTDRFDPFELGPPIIPGVTQLSPNRMSAVLGAQDPRDVRSLLHGAGDEAGEDEHGPEDALPRLIADQGRLLARAAQLGPDALDMVASMVRSVSAQVKKSASMVHIGVAPAESTGQVPVPMQSPLLTPPSPNEWEPPRQAPPILSQLMQMAR